MDNQTFRKRIEEIIAAIPLENDRKMRKKLWLWVIDIDNKRRSESETIKEP